MIETETDDGYWACCEHCGPPLREGVEYGYGDGHPKPCSTCQPVMPAKNEATR